MDALSERLTNEAFQRRLRRAQIVIVILSIIMFVRLFQLMIIEGRTYKTLAENNRQRILYIEPERGIIYDRNGIPLVKNVPYFVAALSGEDFSVERLSEIARFLAIDMNELVEKIKNRKSQIEPVIVKEGLSFEEVARIEARHSDFPEVFIITTTIRKYLYGSTGAHLLGYLGKVTEEQWKKLRPQGIPPDAFIGQWGVEKLYDEILRGRFGKRIIEVDALGHEIRVLGEVPPERGKDLILSIDIEVQKAMEEAYGSRRGAFVAVKPDTGEVLALGSLPSFDPNKFARGADPGYWKSLAEDEGHPLLNRALQSQYPPGSVYKIVTAIAGLEEGIIKPSTTFHCSGSMPFGNRLFRCWKKEGHGTVDLRRAIIESCDVYFYEVGKRVGIDKIAEYAKRLGLGELTAVGLVTEKQGIVPSSEWKFRVMGQPWYPGETLSASIGQGYVSVTPVQLARMVASIARGEYLKHLSLLKINSEGNQRDISKEQNSLKEIRSEKPEINSLPRGTEGLNAGAEPVGISQKTFDFIRDAMKGVVNEPGGTGGAARLKDILVGGKTGTAQVISKAMDTHKLPEKYRDHAWFVAFAPVDKPEIAMAVFVEHGGHGGAAAAPIARIGIERFLKNDLTSSETIISEGD